MNICLKKSPIIFYFVDTTSSVLVFESSTLTGGKTYRLRLAANIYGYSGSFTEYEFITNLPPYGGTCGINPSSGNDNVYL